MIELINLSMFLYFEDHFIIVLIIYFKTKKIIMIKLKINLESIKQLKLVYNRSVYIFFKISIYYYS